MSCLVDLEELEGRAQMVSSFYDREDDHIVVHEVLRWARETIVSQGKEIAQLRKQTELLRAFRDFMRGVL